MKKENQVLSFNTGQEMLDVIKSGTELYCPLGGMYVFGIDKAICLFIMDVDVARKINSLCVKWKEKSWSALIEYGKHFFYDVDNASKQQDVEGSSIDFCSKFYEYEWLRANVGGITL